METNNETNFLITHIVPNEVPKKGLRKLLFYTSTEIKYNEGIFYWGLDIKHPFTESQMNDLEKQEKVIKIEIACKVKANEGLWLSDEGKVYVADINNPKLNSSSVAICAPIELSKASQIYKKSIGIKNVPKTILAIEI